MKAFTIFKSLAGIVPEPKSVTLCAGDCKLSRDVRLTTSNVQPLQRKTMRNIFNSAGIKVVANKKTYLIDASVDENLEIPPEVPEHAKNEYFEIVLSGTVIRLRSASQPGIIWGSSTLAGIYQSYGINETLPNMIIRDWPSMPNRGLFLYSTWLLGMMELNDWTMMGDIMALSRFNQIFFEFSACPSTELFSPQGDPIFFNVFPEGHKLHQLKIDFARLWYSPRFDRWKSKKQYPYAVEKQNIQDILLILRERELNVIPTFSMYAGNRMIPQKAQKLAARRPRGGVKEAGLCYSNELTWKFLELYFEDIFRAHFEGSPKRVCIRLDDGFTLANGESVLCECKQCEARDKNAHIQDFVNVLKLIKEKGAQEIILTDSIEAREKEILGKTFVKLLKKEKLLDSVKLLQQEESLDSFGLTTISNMPINSNDSYFFRNKTKELRHKLEQINQTEELFLSLSYTPLEHEHLLVTGEKLWNKDSQIDPEVLLNNWTLFNKKQSQVSLIPLIILLNECINDLPQDLFNCQSFCDAIEFAKAHKTILKNVNDKLKKNLKQILDIFDIQDLPTNQRATYYIIRAHSSILAAYLSALLIIITSGDKDAAANAIIENMEIAERAVPEWMTMVPFNGLSAILQELRPTSEEPQSI